jgi:hypothetical protein
MAARLYIRFLMASKLISDNATVKASGKKLASESHIKGFLKKIKELDGNGGGVLVPSFLSHITETELY